MTQPEHPRNRSLVVFLAFVGGAVVGGAAVVLLARRSGAQPRRGVTGAVGDAQQGASRVPQALRAASSAAQAAFAAAMEGSAGEDTATAP